MSHRDGMPRAKALWRRVEDPVGHCLDVGDRKHAPGQEDRARGHGAHHHQDPCGRAERGTGGADGGQMRRNVRNGHCSATWLVIEELTQLDTPLWADIACLSMNKKIRFLLLGDFRQLPAVLDSFAWAEVCKELKNSQLLHDLAGGCCHELSERWRFDEQIFEFLSWLRVVFVVF